MTVVGPTQHRGGFTLIQLLHHVVVVIFRVEVQRHPGGGQAQFVFRIFPDDPAAGGLTHVEIFAFVAN
ncbi:hypothetical protein D3C76_1805380 [compost metagenome]